MKYLLVIAILFPLVQQPTELPKERVPSESGRAVNTARTKATTGSQQAAAKASPAPTGGTVAAGSETDAVARSDATGANTRGPDDFRAQNELTWFTGALVVVGFLQFFALVGQVTIYRRQAAIMAHQAREMEQQRITMRDQLATMKDQLLQMEKSGTETEHLADQAVRQTDLTQRQLELEHRPWIAVDVAPESPVIFDERGCVMMCKVTMTNVGHSVAKHVSLWTDFAVLGLDDPIEERDRLCEIMKQPQNENSDYGWLLFPNQNAVEHRPVIASPEKVKRALGMKTFQGLNTTGLHLVGCVGYPSPLDAKKRYQTRFVYSVSYVDTANGSLRGAFDPSVKMHHNTALLPTMHGASAD